MVCLELSTRLGALGLLLGLLLCPMLVLGQGQIGSKDDCRHNDTQADIPVDVTAVVIITPNQGLCGALVVNIGTQPLRCRDTSFGDPTGALGWPLAPGAAAEMTIDAQSGLKCVRDTNATTSSMINVTLKKP